MIIDYDTILIAFVAVFLVVSILQTVYMKRKGTFIRKNIIRKLLLWGYYGYLVFIITITLFPIAIPPYEFSFFTPEINFNIGTMFEYFTLKSGLINMLGNIFLFIPYVILGKFCKIKFLDKWYYAIVSSAIIICGIEILQYIEAVLCIAEIPRAADINDFILNLLGVIIGLFIYKLYAKVNLKCEH
ncbi:MAG: VanZ family protein [Anaerovoracaceae bacterium]|nr:VanZ family protein [Anaerovoracaceae bacterium]